MRTELDTQVAPFVSLVAALQGARWRRLAVLGDSIAEGVRDPHPGFSDLSWIDRIADQLNAAGEAAARRRIRIGYHNHDFELRPWEDGEIPLEFLFGGTVFYAGAGGGLQVQPISWAAEARYRLPVLGCEQARGIGNLQDPRVDHFEASDFIGRPEPILSGAYHPKP